MPHGARQEPAAGPVGSPLAAVGTAVDATTRILAQLGGSYSPVIKSSEDPTSFTPACSIDGKPSTLRPDGVIAWLRSPGYSSWALKGCRRLQGPCGLGRTLND